MVSNDGWAAAINASRRRRAVKMARLNSIYTWLAVVSLTSWTVCSGVIAAQGGWSLGLVFSVLDATISGLWLGISLRWRGYWRQVLASIPNE